MITRRGFFRTVAAAIAGSSLAPLKPAAAPRPGLVPFIPLAPGFRFHRLPVYTAPPLYPSSPGLFNPKENLWAQYNALKLSQAYTALPVIQRPGAQDFALREVNEMMDRWMTERHIDRWKLEESKA